MDVEFWLCTYREPAWAGRPADPVEELVGTRPSLLGAVTAAAGHARRLLDGDADFHLVSPEAGRLLGTVEVRGGQALLIEGLAGPREEWA